jgi:starvation-inducible DNA-binding protein
MKPNIGISEKNANGVTALLNELLSDEYVFYTKLRNYHWNVTGSDFSELHKFFEAQYEEVDDIIDDVAERSRSIGGRPFGTLQQFLKEAQLKEFPGNYPDSKTMIRNLLSDHESIIQKLRKDLAACAEKFSDMGTSDFLTGIMEQHEKMAWMMRAYLD